MELNGKYDGFDLENLNDCASMGNLLSLLKREGASRWVLLHLWRWGWPYLWPSLPRSGRVQSYVLANYHFLSGMQNSDYWVWQSFSLSARSNTHSLNPYFFLRNGNLSLDVNGTCVLTCLTLPLIIEKRVSYRKSDADRADPQSKQNIQFLQGRDRWVAKGGGGF